MQLPFHRPDRGAEILAKIECFPQDPNNQAIEWLYKILTILDAKASGLLRFNGIFIALLAAFLGLHYEGVAFQGIGSVIVIGGQIVLLMLLASSGCCFFVVRVTWKFLGHVRPSAGGVGFDFSDERYRLAVVVDDRTHCYWIAWWLTFGAIIAVSTLTVLGLFSSP